MFKANRGNSVVNRRFALGALLATLVLSELTSATTAHAYPPRGPNYNPTPRPSHSRGEGHRPPPITSPDRRNTNPNGRPVPLPRPRRPGDRPPPIRPVRVPSHVRGRPVPVQPVRSNDRDDDYAHGVVREAIQGARCEAMGDVLRRLSNALLKAASETGQPQGGLVPAGDRVITYQATGPGLRITMRNKAFWERIWERVSDAYRACEITCFDDGYAVGQMSAVSYCSASTSLDGLDGLGFLAQAPLPLCENAVNIGCQNGYVDSAAEFAGCSTYTEGQFESIFAEQVSQDCHMEESF